MLHCWVNLLVFAILWPDSDAILVRDKVHILVQKHDLHHDTKPTDFHYRYFVCVISFGDQLCFATVVLFIKMNAKPSLIHFNKTRVKSETWQILYLYGCREQRIFICWSRQFPVQSGFADMPWRLNCILLPWRVRATHSWLFPPVTEIGRSSALHDLNPTYYFSPTLARFQNTEFINSVDSCSWILPIPTAGVARVLLPTYRN